MPGKPLYCCATTTRKAIGALRLSASNRILATVFFVLTACSDIGASQIHSLLEARDKAIRTQDIGAYSELVADDYHDGEFDKARIVARMIKLFDQFDEIHIESFSREVRFLDSNHAQCIQSYRMKVSVDDIFQEIVQRESLAVERRQGRWFFVGGL